MTNEKIRKLGVPVPEARNKLELFWEELTPIVIKTLRAVEEQDPRVAQCLKEENTGNQHKRRHKVTERILEARVWSVLDRNTGEHEPRTNSETNSSEEKRGN